MNVAIYEHYILLILDVLVLDPHIELIDLLPVIIIDKSGTYLPSYHLSSSFRQLIEGFLWNTEPSKHLRAHSSF